MGEKEKNKELGEWAFTLYKEGKALAIFFPLFGLFFLSLNLFVELDSIGRTMSFAVFGVFTLLGAYEWLKRNDGCYLYENGIKVIRWRKESTFLYTDMQELEIVYSWRISAANSAFISFRKVEFPLVVLSNGERKKLFFEAYPAYIQILTGLLGNKPVHEVTENFHSAEKQHIR